MDYRAWGVPLSFCRVKSLIRSSLYIALLHTIWLSYIYIIDIFLISLRCIATHLGSHHMLLAQNKDNNKSKLLIPLQIWYICIYMYMHIYMLRLIFSWSCWACKLKAHATLVQWQRPSRSRLIRIKIGIRFGFGFGFGLGYTIPSGDRGLGTGLICCENKAPHDRSVLG